MSGMVQFKDGRYQMCQVLRDGCRKPATHHTSAGDHYCDDHWPEVLHRARVRRNIRIGRALDNIERIGRGG